MAKGFLVHVPLNCDARNVAGILDQLEIDGAWITHFTIMDGERSQDVSCAREERSRPNGTDAKWQNAVTIVIPNGVLADVCHIDRLPPINGCAARGAFWANERRSHAFRKSRKTGRHSAIEVLAFGVRKPDGA